MKNHSYISIAAFMLLIPVLGMAQVSFGWQPTNSYVYAVSGTQPNMYSENLQTAQVTDSAFGATGMWYSFLNNGRDTAQTGQCDFNPQAANVLGYGAGMVGAEWQAVGQYGDTIHIPLSLSFGDEFWFQTHPDSAPGNGFRGKVTSIQLTNTLGQPDTLLTIELQYHSAGVSTTNALNGSTFQTSNRFGLRSLPHLGYFPQTFRLMELVGENTQQLGVTDFGFYEIYNFQVGDVFHYEGYEFYSQWYRCDTVIAINYDQLLDQFSISFRRWQHNRYEWPIFDTLNPGGQPIGWDTTDYVSLVDTTIIYQNDETLDKYFGQFTSNPQNEIYNTRGIFHLFFGTDLPAKWTDLYFLTAVAPPVDSCLQQVIDQGNGFYMQNLGLVYLEYFGGYQNMVFYHHPNGDSGGTAINPDDFTVSRPETTAALPISVFPNPTSDFINVRLPFDSQPATFILHDNFGRVVLESTAQVGDSRLQLKHLSSGLYIWQAIGTNGQSATGRVLVR